MYCSWKKYVTKLAYANNFSGTTHGSGTSSAALVFRSCKYCRICWKQYGSTSRKSWSQSGSRSRHWSQLPLNLAASEEPSACMSHSSKGSNSHTAPKCLCIQCVIFDCKFSLCLWRTHKQLALLFTGEVWAVRPWVCASQTR